MDEVQASVTIERKAKNSNQMTLEIQGKRTEIKPQTAALDHKIKPPHISPPTLPQVGRRPFESLLIPAFLTLRGSIKDKEVAPQSPRE